MLPWTTQMHSSQPMHAPSGAMPRTSDSTPARAPPPFINMPPKKAPSETFTDKANKKGKPAKTPRVEEARTKSGEPEQSRPRHRRPEGHLSQATNAPDPEGTRRSNPADDFADFSNLACFFDSPLRDRRPGASDARVDSLMPNQYERGAYRSYDQDFAPARGYLPPYAPYGQVRLLVVMFMCKASSEYLSFFPFFRSGSTALCTKRRVQLLSYRNEGTNRGAHAAHASTL